MSAGGGPELSVVLATTGPEVVARPLEAYRAQTVADRIEMVVVAPPAELARFEARSGSGLEVRLVAAPEPFQLASARAAGALAASAPWLFVGETHSYPEPRLAERLLAAAEAQREAEPAIDCFVPTIVNVNPSGAISVASLLIDYGAWGPGHTGAVARPPIYNALFRRAVVAANPRLVAAMAPADDTSFPVPIDGRHRAVMVPEASIAHLNVVRFGDLVRSKCWLGMAVGDARGRRWGWPRRLLYAAAAPAIAAVLLRRYLADLRIVRAHVELPGGIVPLLLVGAAARAAGEAIGYLGWKREAVDRRLERLEIHKRDFVPGWR
jgi:hypothetical protein